MRCIRLANSGGSGGFRTIEWSRERIQRVKHLVSVDRRKLSLEVIGESARSTRTEDYNRRDPKFCPAQGDIMANRLCQSQ